MLSEAKNKPNSIHDFIIFMLTIEDCIGKVHVENLG